MSYEQCRCEGCDCILDADDEFFFKACEADVSEWEAYLDDPEDPKHYQL